jgi:uncharacterized protein involved in cysteine biosynthesis
MSLRYEAAHSLLPLGVVFAAAVGFVLGFVALLWLPVVYCGMMVVWHLPRYLRDRRLDRELRETHRYLARTGR